MSGYTSAAVVIGWVPCIQTAAVSLLLAAAAVGVPAAAVAAVRRWAR